MTAPEHTNSAHTSAEQTTATDSTPAAQLKSLLLDVDGVGPAALATVMATYPSLDHLAGATRNDLLDLNGIGPATADRILAALADHQLADQTPKPAPATENSGPGRVLLIVDMQRDFCDATCAAYVPGADQVAGRINDHLAAHRNDYGLVIATRDVHHNVDAAHLDVPHGNPDDGGTDLMIDTDLVDQIADKGRFAAAPNATDADLAGTTVADAMVTHTNQPKVDVVGVTLATSVLPTAAELAQRGIDVTVNLDLVADRDGDPTSAAPMLEALGITVTGVPQRAAA